MATLIYIAYALGAVITWLSVCFYVSRNFSRDDTRGAGWAIWVLAAMWPFLVLFLIAEAIGKTFAYGPEWVIDRMREKPVPIPEPEAKDEYR